MSWEGDTGTGFEGGDVDAEESGSHEAGSGDRGGNGEGGPGGHISPGLPGHLGGLAGAQAAEDFEQLGWGPGYDYLGGLAGAVANVGLELEPTFWETLEWAGASLVHTAKTAWGSFLKSGQVIGITAAVAPPAAPFTAAAAFISSVKKGFEDMPDPLEYIGAYPMPYEGISRDAAEPGESAGVSARTSLGSLGPGRPASFFFPEIDEYEQPPELPELAQAGPGFLQALSPVKFERAAFDSERIAASSPSLWPVIFGGLVLWALGEL